MLRSRLRPVKPSFKESRSRSYLTIAGKLCIVEQWSDECAALEVVAAKTKQDKAPSGIRQRNVLALGDWSFGNLMTGI